MKKKLKEKVKTNFGRRKREAKDSKEESNEKKNKDDESEENKSKEKESEVKKSKEKDSVEEESEEKKSEEDESEETHTEEEETREQQEDRIVNGIETKTQPWMATLATSDGKAKIKCGGALINKRYIM